MVDTRTLLQQMRERLRQAGLTAANELNVLCETAVGERPTLLAFKKEMDDATAQALRDLVQRRIDGEPLQYIAGSWPFLDFDLCVGPGVLIPRADTEALAVETVDRLIGAETPRVLDLCSGSGCVAIAVARTLKGADVTAVELSDEALPYLVKNIAALAPQVRVVQADVFAYQNELADESLDCIISNPPYVTPAEYADNRAELQHEPQMAFLGGEDGLDFYRHIIPAYKAKLKTGGRMLFETGSGQTEAVAELFRKNGYTDIRIIPDMFGLPRVTAAQKGDCNAL